MNPFKFSIAFNGETFQASFTKLPAYSTTGNTPVKALDNLLYKLSANNLLTIFDRKMLVDFIDSIEEENE